MTGLQIHRILQTPRKLHYKVRNRCACHEVCAYRRRFTQSALQGSRSAAPAMKSAVPVRKVLRLPRALQLKVLKVLRTKCRSCHETCYMEVLKVLCLPRNLHFQCTKCRSCHETCYLLLEVFKVLRLPRNLQFKCTKCRSCHEICSSSAQSATKSATGDAQSAAPATKFAHPDSHRAALPRRFAVAGAALCERYFVFDTN